jgi:hypothetical protein
MDMKIRSVRFDLYGTVVIRPVNTRLHLFKAFQRVWMGKAKDVLKTAADHRYLRSNPFKEGRGAGMGRTMVRSK